MIAPQVKFLFHPAEYLPTWSGPHVWVFNLDEEHHCHLLLEGEGGQGGHMPLWRDLECHRYRRRQVIGRALTRHVAAHHLGCPAERIILRADPHGRLFLAAEGMPDCPAAASLDLNISHSDNILLVGVNREGRIGVDVEMLREEVDVEAVARAHFSPAERRRLRHLDPAQRAACFYKCWTAKEAFAKAVGLGLGFGLEQIETTLGADGALRISAVNGSERLAEGWLLAHRTVTIGGATALAAVVLTA